MIIKGNVHFLSKELNEFKDPEKWRIMLLLCNGRFSCVPDLERNNFSRNS